MSTKIKLFIVYVLLVVFGLGYLSITPDPEASIPKTEQLRQEYVQHMHEKEVMKAVQDDLYNR